MYIVTFHNCSFFVSIEMNIWICNIPFLFLISNLMCIFICICSCKYVLYACIFNLYKWCCIIYLILFLLFASKSMLSQSICISSDCCLICNGGIPFILPVFSLRDNLPGCLQLPNYANNGTRNILVYIFLLIWACFLWNAYSVTQELNYKISTYLIWLSDRECSPVWLCHLTVLAAWGI